MNNKLHIAKKYYNLFQELHDELATTRNFVGCFSKICVDKITEYEPNVKFKKELNSFLADYFEEHSFDEIQKAETKSVFDEKINELLEKYNVTLTKLNEKTKEQIANGTKIGIKLHSLEEKINFYFKSQNQILVNALQNMTTSFEDFLAGIFTEHYIEHCSALNGKQIKFEFINLASSLDEAKSAFVHEEVEELLHKGVKDLLETLFKTLKIDSPFFNKHKKNMLELFYRRNIFVHNKGVVNKTYLSLSGNPYSFHDGDTALINVDYLYNAAALLLLTGADIITSIISKLKFPNNEFEEEENKVSIIAFEHYLMNEDWSFAEDFYEILLRNNHLSETSQDVYKLNILLCKKKLGKANKSFIKKEKWDAKRAFLRIGYKALVEEYDDLSKLIINNYGSEDGVDKNSLETWPIFIDYRQTEQYAKTIEVVRTMEHEQSNKME